MMFLLRVLRSAVLPASALLLSQAAGIAQTTKPGPVQPEDAPAPVEKNAATDRASAYYNYSMGHLYAELAQAYNRQDYITKAIDFYKLALKQDPTIPFIAEELNDLYIETGQLSKAVTAAEDALKQNPNDLGARRTLGRVYVRNLGDLQQGKVDEKMLHLAIEQYAKIFEKEPTDTESALTLARLDHYSHDTAGEEKVYKTILAREPDNEEALAGLASLLADRGDPKSAIETLKRASDTNPNPRTLVMLAQLYEKDENFAAAADAWKQALQMAPDQERWKRPLALDLLFSDQLEDARKLYEQFAQENPKDGSVQLRLAEVYLAQHDNTKARTAIDAAKQIEPDNLDVKVQEANLLREEGKTDEAVAQLKSVLDQTAKPDYSAAEQDQRNRLLNSIGQIYIKGAKYQQAVAAFRQIPAENDEWGPRASLEIVETLRKAKDMNAARKEADAAVKRWPKDRGVVLEHASVVYEQGKRTEAFSEIDALKDGKNTRQLLLFEAELDDHGKRYSDEEHELEAAQQLSTGKDEVVAVEFMRGAMLEKQKNFEGAEAEFRKIIAADPNNASALNYLGYMLADRNTKLEEAQDLINRALKVDPQNYAYLDSLGWVYFHQNRLDAAENQLRRALDKVSTDPTIHEHLGDVLAKQGKVKEAIAQWQSSLQNWDSTSSDSDPADLAKLKRKLEDAEVRIAEETHANRAH